MGSTILNNNIFYYTGKVDKNQNESRKCVEIQNRKVKGRVS